MVQMKRPSRWYCAAAPWVFVVACSGGAASNPQADRTSSLQSAVTAQTNAPIRKTVRTAEQTQVWLQTTPKAICRLYALGDTKGLQLPATDEGVVQFYFMAAADGVETPRLDCQGESGPAVTYAMELTSTSDPAVLASATSTLTPMPLAQGVSRPPLIADPMQFTQGELIAMGFPPRPDPVATPGAYAAWLHAASVSSPRVSPRLVAADARAATMSANYSGYFTTPIANSVVVTQGEWLVPAVKPKCYIMFQPPFTGCRFEAGQDSRADLWIGIDAYPDDLLQDGTASEVYCAFNGSACYFNYMAWEEYFPAQNDKEYAIAAVPVQPGDDVYFVTWVGDYNGNPIPNGGYAWFYVQNFTHPAYTYVPVTATANIGGYTTEWIMERPQIVATPQTFSWMANYQSAVVESAAWMDSNNVWYNANQQPTHSFQYTMYTANSGGNLLSTASWCSNADPQCISFQWYNFN
jgi:hypothetical protein